MFCFPIRLYENLKPHYYHVYVYTNKKYIDSILVQQKKKRQLYLFTFILLFFLVYWIVMKRIIVEPLEKLRLYARSSTNKPAKIFHTRQSRVSVFSLLANNIPSAFKQAAKQQAALQTFNKRYSKWAL